MSMSCRERKLHPRGAELHFGSRLELFLVETTIFSSWAENNIKRDGKDKIDDCGGGEEKKTSPIV